MGPRYFLDVNGDGLPDVVQLDVMTGRPATILNTGDRHGARLGAPIAAVLDTIAPDFASLWSLAAVLDINGDGRQDLLVPGIEGDGGAGWKVLESKGDGTFALIETVTMRPPGIAVHGYISTVMAGKACLSRESKETAARGGSSRPRRARRGLKSPATPTKSPSGGLNSSASRGMTGGRNWMPSARLLALIRGRVG
jgi:hypothetical protein